MSNVVLEKIAEEGTDLTGKEFVIPYTDKSHTGKLLVAAVKHGIESTSFVRVQGLYEFTGSAYHLTDNQVKVERFLKENPVLKRFFEDDLYSVIF